MSLSYELSKIKDAFVKVRNDMNFLSGKISENYEEFMRHHQKLHTQVQELSEKLKHQINEIKHMDFSHSSFSDKDILDLKHEIKELKRQVVYTHEEHGKITTMLADIKKAKSDVKDLKEKLHSSELEIYLLKERIAEKDVEIKQIKDVNKHMFSIIDDLSHIELDIINRASKNKQ